MSERMNQGQINREISHKARVDKNEIMVRIDGIDQRLDRIDQKIDELHSDLKIILNNLDSASNDLKGKNVPKA